MQRRNLLTSNKYLRHSDEHFQGYWVQLQSLLRQNEDADELLDGSLRNPLEDLINAYDEWKDVVAPPANPGPEYTLYEVCTCIKTLYTNGNYGIPPGEFPPKDKDFKEDPMAHIREWNLATEKGTKGGLNARGAHDQRSRAWVRRTHQKMLSYRNACKFMWETAVATLSTAQATTIIAGLPYGSGPALL